MFIFMLYDITAVINVLEVSSFQQWRNYVQP